MIAEASSAEMQVPAWRAAAGRWLLWPWMDGLTLTAISDWYLPLSRAWAAALDEQADFGEALGLGAAEAARCARAIAKTRARRRDYLLAEAAWQRAFFGESPQPQAALAEAQDRRIAAAQGLMLARRHFLPLQLRRRLPRVRWQIASPEEAEARQGGRLAEPETAFPALTGAEIRESQAVERCHGLVSSLRFTSPLGDEAWARVVTPQDVVDPPTLVFLHGLTIETEMWSESVDPIAPLAAQGIRVLRVEGPWHGRRRLPGFYGGEPILGRGVLGLLEAFEAWAREVSAWIAWARRSSNGPVAVGGISLGALTSQLVLTASRDWPPSLRPDAALLLAVSGDLLATAHEGALPSALGLRPELQAAGWDENLIRPWLALLEPWGAPAIAPERILMLLGRADKVTPFETGLALARRWGLPPANLLRRGHQGHFTLDLGLSFDPGPLYALARLLKSL